MSSPVLLDPSLVLGQSCLWRVCGAWLSGHNVLWQWGSVDEPILFSLHFLLSVSWRYMHWFCPAQMLEFLFDINSLCCSRQYWVLKLRRYFGALIGVVVVRSIAKPGYDLLPVSAPANLMHKREIAYLLWIFMSYCMHFSFWPIVLGVISSVVRWKPMLSVARCH